MGRQGRCLSRTSQNDPAAETRKPSLQGRHSCFRHVGTAGQRACCLELHMQQCQQLPGTADKLLSAQPTCASPQVATMVNLRQVQGQPHRHSTGLVPGRGKLTSPVCLCRWQCSANHSITHTRKCTYAVLVARQAQRTCAPLQVVVLRKIQHDPDQRLRLPGCCPCLSHPAVDFSSLRPALQALEQLPQCALLLGVPAGT